AVEKMEGFFFFQAEDGIRDGHVTGVQTCALPIFMFMCLARNMTFTTPSARTATCGGTAPPHTASAAASNVLGTVARAASWARARSEERRVGKECRCRWVCDA